jgi:hypothetical protein
MLKKVAVIAGLLFAVERAEAQGAVFNPTNEGSPFCYDAYGIANTTYRMSWATSCRGAFVGNTNNTGLTTWLNTAFGGWAPTNSAPYYQSFAGSLTLNLTYVGETGDQNNGPFSSFTNNQTVGTVNFDGLLANRRYILGIKAGPQMSFYLFNSNVVAGNSLVFNTAGTKVNGNDFQAMSHASLWLDNTLITTTTTPEPSTYILMAAGLAGIGIAARRRKQS